MSHNDPAVTTSFIEQMKIGREWVLNLPPRLVGHGIFASALTLRNLFDDLEISEVRSQVPMLAHAILDYCGRSPLNAATADVLARHIDFPSLVRASRERDVRVGHGAQAWPHDIEIDNDHLWRHALRRLEFDSASEFQAMLKISASMGPIETLEWHDKEKPHLDAVRKACTAMNAAGVDAREIVATYVARGRYWKGHESVLLQLAEVGRHTVVLEMQRLRDHYRAQPQPGMNEAHSIRTLDAVLRVAGQREAVRSATIAGPIFTAP